jgi:hypothetical protein
MPTTQEEKPAKPRSRSRKAEQRSSKGGPKRAEARAEANPVSAMVAETEAAMAETGVALEAAPVAAMEPAVADEVTPAPEPDVTAEPAMAMEKSEEERFEETVLSGEVLPPEGLRPAQVDGFQAIAQAYGDYTKKSWLNGRFLMERLIAVRSFDEAIEIHGEFAKQAYANFLTHSQKVCVLYGEWAQQLFRPLERLAADWPRIGR